MKLTELDNECLEGILNLPSWMLRHERQHVFQLIKRVSAKRRVGLYEIVPASFCHRESQSV